VVAQARSSGKVGSTGRPAKRIVQAVVRDREQRRNAFVCGVGLANWGQPVAWSEALRRGRSIKGRIGSIGGIGGRAHLQQAVSTALHADCARPDPDQRAGDNEQRQGGRARHDPAASGAASG